MIRVQRAPQAEAVNIESREGNIIIAGLDDWFRQAINREGMKPAIDLVDFYPGPKVLCNFLNDSDLENSAVAAFAQLHWRDFEGGGLFVRLGSKKDQKTLRTEIKESVLNLIDNPDSLKLAKVRDRLRQYEFRMRIQLLEVDTNPFMDHLVDMSERNRGANKNGITYDPNTMEVRSKKLSLGKKTIIATVGLESSGTLRDLMYGLLIKVLRDEEIGQIRRCKTCGSFNHYTTKPKDYCNDKCRYQFWNADEGRKSKRKSKSAGGSNELAIAALRQMQKYIRENRVRAVEDLPLTASDSQFAKLRNLLGNRFDSAVLNRLWNESPEAIVKTLSPRVNRALSESLQG
jgi:hypothetical protein